MENFISRAISAKSHFQSIIQKPQRPFYLSPALAWTFFLGLPQFSHAAVAPATAPAPLESSVPSTAQLKPEEIQKLQEPKLSDVTRGHLGIEDESAEALQTLLEKSKRFVRYRKRTLTQAEWGVFQQDCSKDPSAVPFCQEMLELQSDESQRSKKRIRSRKSSKRTLATYAQWIREGKLENLKPLSEENLLHALKMVRHLAELESVSQAILQASNCTNQTLGWLLGVKMEEFLPEETARKKAIQLYEKSAQCNTEVNDFSLKVRLRLSLLKIWESDCTGALPHLKFLSENATPNTDYAPRALFWQYQCGSQLKKAEISVQSKKALIQRYPVSLQTVLAQIDESSSGPNYSSKIDSPVQLRVVDNSPLNQRIRAIESLLKIQEPRYALALLNQLEPQIERTPPRFRLYLAALYFRVDDSIHRFKLLSSIFREDPELLSKTSLELFYPDHTALNAKSKTTALDKMLLLALVRQESAFNSKARSPAGALGLMQIMPRTARRFFRLRSPSQLYNPEVNLQVGSRYFSNLLKNYGGDAELALAAYNAGPKRVEEWLKRYPVKDRALFLDLIPFRETRDYVSSIARNYFWYVSLYSGTLTQSTEGRKTLGKVFNLFKS